MSSHDHLASRLENTCCLKEVENKVSLIGAIIADVVPNIGEIKGSLISSWKYIGSFTLAHLYHNLFSIKATPECASKLLEGGPWHVDNMRFNVVKRLPNPTISDIHFHKVWYWVQISGLTKEKMNTQNAKLIGSKIGSVLEIEDPDKVDATLRGFLRVKVLMDSRNPFPTSFWLPLNNNTSTRVDYTYEGLCDFCYKCGRLGHHLDVCKNFRLINLEEGEPENIWYGPWMKRKPLSIKQQSWLERPTTVYQKKPKTRRATELGFDSSYASHVGTSYQPQGYSSQTTLADKDVTCLFFITELDDEDLPSHNSNVQITSVRNPDTCHLLSPGPHANLPVTAPKVTPFPSPHWLKVAVTTTKTHVEWTKRVNNLCPLPQTTPTNKQKPSHTSTHHRPKPVLPLPLLGPSLKPLKPNPSCSYLIVGRPVLPPLTQDPFKGKGQALLSYSLFNQAPSTQLPQSQPISISCEHPTPLHFNSQAPTLATAKRIRSQTNPTDDSLRHSKTRLITNPYQFFNSLEHFDQYTPIPAPTISEPSRGRDRAWGRGRRPRGGRAGVDTPVVRRGLYGINSDSHKRRFKSVPNSDLALSNFQEIQVEILDDSADFVSASPRIENDMEVSSPTNGGGGWPTGTSHQ